MSAEKLEKYQARAARYVLSYEDNTIVRFAAYPKGAKTHQTRVVNLSETGMAFLLPFLDNPKDDELIKVEFKVPNGGTMACFAKVIRVETHQTFNQASQRQQFKLVAVTFVDLPVAQRQMIREGLLKEFEKMSKEYTKEQLKLKAQWVALQSVSGAKKLMEWPISQLMKLMKKK